MNFINKQNGIRVVAQLFDDAFQALLKISAVLRASEQRSHVQRIDVSLGENLGNVTLNNSARQSFGNGGFAHTRLTHQQGIVFTTTTERLNDALKFLVAADQRVDLAL